MTGQVEETVTLSQAKELIACLAHEESVLLLSPPGVGKSEVVAQAAAEAGLPCRSLLGTQIAPEDVSGIPRIIGERSVFCPPRVLLPESNEPFCLFLDELPACTPDIQKAFYSLLLERRVGEHHLPPGSWVVAAGNRAEDRALVRTISSALVNRVIVLNVRVDVGEWITWAQQNSVDRHVISYIAQNPGALLRDIPSEPAPFSTPRAWTLLSQALGLAEEHGLFGSNDPLGNGNRDELCEALAEGRVTPDDGRRFSNWWRINRRATDGLSPFDYAGLLRIAIYDLGLSQAAIQMLQARDVSNLSQLVELSEIDLRHGHPRFDQARIGEIKEALAGKGLWLGMRL